MAIDLSTIATLAAALIQVRKGTSPEAIADALGDARVALDAFEEKERQRPSDPRISFLG